MIKLRMRNQRTTVICKYLIPAVLMVLASGTVFPQTIEPDEPELVLPRILLQIRDLSIESVQTVLPDQSGPDTPRLVTVLPEEAALQVPDSAFDVSLPAHASAGDVNINRESSIFSDGMIGIGSMNHILGSVSIYKLGEEPRFNLQFQHEGTDGFSGEQAGTGFSSREDLLLGSLDLKYLGIESGHDISFRETEIGLQQQSERYNSVLNRFTSLGNSVRFSPSSLFSLSAAFNLGISDMILSTREVVAGVPNVFSELTLIPTIEAKLSYPDFSLGLSGRYGFNRLTDREDTIMHRGRVTASFDVNFSLPVYLEGNIGMYWSSVSELYVPFSLGISGRLQDTASIFIKGGYKVEEQSYTSLWNKIPYTQVPAADAAISDTHGFFIEGGFSWLLTKGFTFAGSLAFSSTENTISVRMDSFDAVTGLFPFEQVLLMRLVPSADLSWQWNDILSLVISYKGELMERPAQVPIHSLKAAADFGSPLSRFGGTAAAGLDFFSDLVVPRIDLGGSFRLSDGVKFILELDDLFEPLLEQGRRQYGNSPYIEPGFRLTLKTKISL